MYRHIVNTCTVPRAATVLGVMVTTENNVKKLKFCHWLLYIFFLLCWPWDNIVWPSIINYFDSLWPSCLNPSLGTHEILQKLSFSISFFWQQNIFLCQIFLIQSYVFVEDYASAALYLLVLLHLHLEKLIISINCTHSYCHNPNNCASVCGCCKTFFICIQAAITPFSHCHAHMFVPYWCLSCHISNRQPQVA